MEPKFILDIIGVFFEILLAYLFFRIFYKEWRVSPKSAGIIYILVFIVKVTESYYLSEAWMKTVFSLLCCLILISCYRGITWQKILITFFFWSIEAVIEYLVHGILMLLAGEVYTLEKNLLQSYALGLLISKFSAMIMFSLFYYYKKNKETNALQELNYKWYLAFLIYPFVTLIAIIQNYYLILEVQTITSLNRFLVISVLLALSNLIIFRILNEMQHLQAVKL